MVIRKLETSLQQSNFSPTPRMQSCSFQLILLLHTSVPVARRSFQSPHFGNGWCITFLQMALVVLYFIRTSFFQGRSIFRSCSFHFQTLAVILWRSWACQRFLDIPFYDYGGQLSPHKMLKRAPLFSPLQKPSHVSATDLTVKSTCRQCKSLVIMQGILWSSEVCIELQFLSCFIYIFGMCAKLLGCYFLDFSS